MSLTSGLVLLIVYVAYGVDTSHRASAAEKHHKATTRVVLGIDAKGVLSNVDTQRSSSTSVGEVQTIQDAEAETSSSGRFEPPAADQPSEQSAGGAVATGRAEAPPQPPSSGEPKGMMRREARRKPTEVANSSDTQDISSSLLQVESSPAGLCMTEVKSAALDVGNFASFKLNGRMVNPPTGRGFNILVVNEDWTEMDQFRAFDTCGRRGDNQQMMDFLMELPDGTCILVAVKDDATMQITSASRLVLENFGATQSFDIAFRNSYALIGCKGQPKIKEVLVQRDLGATEWLCPERCEWGEWEEWEECSASCGGGEERRTRERIQEGEPGGWPCEGEPHETRACGEVECTTTTNTTTTTTIPMLMLPSGAQRMRLCSVFALLALAAPVLAL